MGSSQSASEKKQDDFDKLLNTYKFMVSDASGYNSLMLKMLIEDKMYMFKIDSSTEDNSLQMERDIYTLIKTQFQKDSPHFLCPESVGQTTDMNILSMKNSSVPYKRNLYKQWILYRSALLTYTYSKTPEWSELVDRMDLVQGTLAFAEYLLFEDVNFKNKFRNVHYVMIEEIVGETLESFLFKDDLPKNILEIITVQMAQALCVLDKYKILYNDLHFQNVYVQTWTNPKEVQYHFPKPVTLFTNYEVIIFDFARVSTLQMYHKGLDITCKSCGQCNTYVPKFDWYTFLTFLISVTPEKNNFGIEQFKLILGDLNEHKIGMPHQNELTNNVDKCDCCREQDLNSLISPNTFLETYFGTSLYKSTVEEEKDQEDKTPTPKSAYYVYLAGNQYDKSNNWSPFKSKKDVIKFAFFKNMTFVNRDAKHIDYIITTNNIDANHSVVKSLIIKHHPQVDTILEALKNIAKNKNAHHIFVIGTNQDDWFPYQNKSDMENFIKKILKDSVEFIEVKDSVKSSELKIDYVLLPNYIDAENPDVQKFKDENNASIMTFGSFIDIFCKEMN